MKKDNYGNFSGFTIVELLVVIVVIGILATISIVAYSGITKQATVSSLKFDLAQQYKKLEAFRVLNDRYPSEFNCPATGLQYCPQDGSISSYSYTPTTNGLAYALKKKDNNVRYAITGSPQATECPDNFIIVPGSVTYGTSNFCVMKYEAKNDGNGKAVSVAAGIPWYMVNQTEAKTYSSNTCAGCHLITEPEWMTIAQNVLKVSSNWSTGIVGNGFIYRGNSNPTVAEDPLGASTDDTDCYYGTGDSMSLNPSQCRVLTLSNGEKIWDLSGNTAEWTDQIILKGNYPSGLATLVYNWNSLAPVVLSELVIPYNSTPISTGVALIETWTMAYGIGQVRTVLSGIGQASDRSFLRGGGNLVAAINNAAGVLSLSIVNNPLSDGSISRGGFRVAR